LKTKIQLIEEDPKDIDNYLFKMISSNRNIITKKIYTKYVSYECLDLSENILKRITRKIFAKKVFELGAIYNINFPHNIDHPKGAIDYNSNLNEYKQEYYKMFGWIESALKYPFLRRFIKVTQSSNGQFSLHTKINLWILRRLGSPGRVDYILKRLVHQSNYFIHLYDKRFFTSFQVIADSINRKIKPTGTKFTRYKLNKKDAMRVAVNTLINYHKDLRQPYGSNELPGKHRELFVKLLHSEFESGYGFRSYRDSVRIFVIIIRLKRNDPALLLKCI